MTQKGYHLRSSVADVSRSFQDTIGSALRKNRVPNRDLLGKLAITFSYWLACHIPRDWYDLKDKAAIVGKLVIQGKEKLGIGKNPDAQDVARTKIFLQSEEGVIWMSAWFELRNEQVQDPKRQHKTLVNDRLQLLQLRTIQAATRILPPVAPPGTMTGMPCLVCFGARCGRGLLCQSIGHGASNPIETPTPDAVQEPNGIPRDQLFRFKIPRPLLGVVGFFAGAAVWSSSVGRWVSQGRERDEIHDGKASASQMQDLRQWIGHGRQKEDTKHGAAAGVLVLYEHRGEPSHLSATSDFG
ncbi:hypothetical protein PMIN07_003630 [Paraphaeosphaeria minitans]